MKQETIDAQKTEVARARVKFPKCNHMVVATMEEMGEVSNAALEIEYGSDTREHFRKECIQLACTAIRLYEEGDTEFPGTLP